ncbi:hypothetical protein [Leptospira sp. 'Mane']|uniref:hypothetical protein n=1 Tax=Leptospira sp. 'Mane' TaxID=3387407 RepID=UPI00398AB307
MKKRQVSLIQLSAFLVLWISISLSLNADSVSAKFSEKLCAAWNESSLVTDLASESAGGSGWIDVVTGVSEVKEGTQIIVSGRYDCSETPEYYIRIEKKENKAVCLASGLYDGQRTWQFLPRTEEYKEFAAKFGLGAFYSLWNNGMKGNKVTAWNNSKYFQTFKEK